MRSDLYNELRSRKWDRRSKYALICLCLLFIAGFSFAWGYGVPLSFEPVIEANIANEVRQQQIVLNARAQTRAQWLCDTGQWSHNGWISSFEGLEYRYMAENLARGFDTYAEAHTAWLASPPHRANLLNPNHTLVGFGQGDCGVMVELYAGN